MKDELDIALCRDFPILYRDRDDRRSCMFYGFPGDGWEPLIRRLSEKLEVAIRAFVKSFPLEEPPRALQVKEKFGSLRFYLSWSDDVLDGWIAEAEEESARTCEVCGKPGLVRNKKGWLYAACDEHERT